MAAARSHMCTALLLVVAGAFCAAKGARGHETYAGSSPEGLHGVAGMRATCEETGESNCRGVEGSLGDRGRHLTQMMRYFISYGALSANSVTCKPRSGRSYYTENCFDSDDPAQPYKRGCSAITRCVRDTS